MNKFKRLLSLLLVAVMVVGMFPMTASAEDQQPDVSHIETCMEGCTGENCACTCHQPAQIDETPVVLCDKCGTTEKNEDGTPKHAENCETLKPAVLCDKCGTTEKNEDGTPKHAENCETLKPAVLCDKCGTTEKNEDGTPKHAENCETLKPAVLCDKCGTTEKNEDGTPKHAEGCTAVCNCTPAGDVHMPYCNLYVPLCGKCEATKDANGNIVHAEGCETLKPAVLCDKCGATEKNEDGTPKHAENCIALCSCTPVDGVHQEGCALAVKKEQTPFEKAMADLTALEEKAKTLADGLDPAAENYNDQLADVIWNFVLEVDAVIEAAWEQYMENAISNEEMDALGMKKQAIDTYLFEAYRYAEGQIQPLATGFTPTAVGTSTPNIEVHLFNYGNQINTITNTHFVKDVSAVEFDNISTSCNKYNQVFAKMSNLDAEGYPSVSQWGTQYTAWHTTHTGSWKNLFNKGLAPEDSYSPLNSNNYTIRHYPINDLKLFTLDENTGWYSYDSRYNAAVYNHSDRSLTAYNYALRPSNFQVSYPRSQGAFLPFNEKITADSTNVTRLTDASGNKAYTTLPSGISPLATSYHNEGYGDWTGYLLASDKVKNLFSLNSGVKADMAFGMSVEFQFKMPAGGKVNGQDMIYEFQGDDDLVVYIDNKPVLNIAGHHEAIKGTINFNTGDVIIYENGKPYEVSWYRSEQSTNSGALDLDPDMESSALFGADWKTNEFKEGSIHTVKIFYMERVGGASNCVMKFNLPVVPKGSVSVKKEVSGTVVNADTEYTFSVSATHSTENVSSFTYDLYNANGSLAGRNNSISNNGTFKLKNGQKAFFSLPHGTKVSFTETNAPDTADKTWKKDGTAMTEGTQVTIDQNKQIELVCTNVPATGSVKVKKTVVGDTLGNNDTFTFKAMLYDANNNQIAFPSAVTLTGMTKDNGKSNSNKTWTFTLKHNVTATFANLPVGAVLKVKEDTHDDYTTKINPTNGQRTVKTSAQTITFTNTLKKGGVQVTKTVSGDTPANGDTFTFKATLYKTNGTTALDFADDVTLTVGTTSITTGKSGNTWTFTMKGGQTATFANLPVGAKLKVEETPHGDYTTKIDGTTTSVTTKEVTVVDQTIAVTNTLKTAGVNVVKVVTGDTPPSAATFAFKATLWKADGSAQIAFPTSAAISGAKTNSKANSDKTWNFTLVGAGTVKFTNLPAGAILKVEETDIPDNYTLTSTSPTTGKQTVTVGSTPEIKFTNKYTIPEHTLTVTKSVTDTSGYDTNFNFSLILDDSTITKVKYSKNGGAETELDINTGDYKGQFRFTLKKNQNIKFTLPAGVGYEVKEDAYSNYTTTYDGNQTGTLNSDVSTTVKNARKTFDVTVEKIVSGVDLEKTFEFKATLSTRGTKFPSTVGTGITLNSDKTEATFSLTAGESIVLKGLPRGAKLTVVETNTQGALTTTWKVGTGAETTGTTATYSITAKRTITFTNTYPTLTVTKDVIDDSGYQREYWFDLKLSDSSITSVTRIKNGAQLVLNKDSSGAFRFKLVDGESIIFTLPKGVEYEVTEDTYTNFNTTYDGKEKGTLNGNVSTTVTNTRKTRDVTIEKDVEGAYSGADFIFSATMKIGSTSLTFPENVGTGVTLSQDKKTATFQLGDGESMKLSNLPQGATLTVKETNKQGATATTYKIGTAAAKTGVEAAYEITENQTITFTNTFRGNVSVTKQVSGITTEEKFQFTATLSGDKFPTNPGEDITRKSDTKATFELAHGETVTFNGLLAGAELTIVETEKEIFTTTTNVSKNATAKVTVVANDTKNVTYTNTLITKTLTIQKNLVDPDGKAAAQYPVTVIIGGSNYRGSATVNGAAVQITNGLVNLKPGAANKIVIANIPVGSSYSVAETLPTAPDGYKYLEPTYSVNGGTASKTAPSGNLNEDVSVQINNELVEVFGKLTIKKEGIQEVDHHTRKDDFRLEEQQSTIYRITGTSDSNKLTVDMKVTIVGNGQVTIDNLPVGTYTVTEEQGWSWRYDLVEVADLDKTLQVVTSGGSVYVDEDGNTITFTNQRDKHLWLSGDNYVWNHFGQGKK